MTLAVAEVGTILLRNIGEGDIFTIAFVCVFSVFIYLGLKSRSTYLSSVASSAERR